MRRPLALLATTTLVAGSALLITPAAHAAPSLDSAGQRFADFTFSLSDTTDLVPGQDGLTLTITKTGTDPLCQRYDAEGQSWTESGDGDPVTLYLALYAVDGETYTTVGGAIPALNSGVNYTYTTGMTELAAGLELERVLVPGPYVAYAICEDGFTGARQFSRATAELPVTFTPFTFSPSPTPAGSTTTLTVPRPDVWCSGEPSDGYSAVIYYAASPTELIDGEPAQLATDWEEESGPALGSFNPHTGATISIPVTLPADIESGTYSVAIQCVAPESDYFEESGSARYFGTLTVGPLAESEPEVTPPTPAETLPNTGASEAWVVALLAAGLLTGGVLLLTRARRTTTL